MRTTTLFSPQRPSPRPPLLQELPAPKTLFIGNLPPSGIESDLLEQFHDNGIETRRAWVAEPTLKDCRLHLELYDF
ncbi:hypothetical protein Pelo_10991 [Pelomyxa schiedti]|nr:hypothetical protein Pelo_10991 [Pelomyxa schiedti]